MSMNKTCPISNLMSEECSDGVVTCYGPTCSRPTNDRHTQLPPCKRCAVSARKRTLLDSLLGVPNFVSGHSFGRIEQLRQLRPHLSNCVSCLRTRSKVVHFVCIGLQIVKLIYAIEINVVNVFPSSVANSLVTHIRHTRENLVREVFD